MNRLFSDIWAATIEKLTDGRWQAQVTLNDSCEPSQWVEADTVEQALRLAIGQAPDEPQYNCLDCGEPIKQTGTKIPGVSALGYARYCDDCIEQSLG